MMDGRYFVPAINTLYAPWWKIMLARAFGKKCVEQDGNTRVTTHTLFGTTYLTKTERIPPC